MGSRFTRIRELLKNFNTKTEIWNCSLETEMVLINLNPENGCSKIPLRHQEDFSGMQISIHKRERDFSAIRKCKCIIHNWKKSKFYSLSCTGRESSSWKTNFRFLISYKSYPELDIFSIFRNNFLFLNRFVFTLSERIFRNSSRSSDHERT